MKLFLIFIAILGCSFARAEKIQLALNWKPEPQFGGFYQAEFDGQYKKQGLDVQILEGGSGTPTVQMLANSKVDFAIVSAEEILVNNDHNPNNQVVALFAVFQTNPQVIICRPELGFTSLKQVLDSNVTLSWQSGLTYAKYLTQKYSPKKVQIVPYSGGITTLLNQKNFCQQGFATSEPLLAEKMGLAAKVFLVSAEGFNPYTTVLAARARTIQSNPELVKKMTAAVHSGWQSYLHSPDMANTKMGALNKAMDGATFKGSAQAQMNLIEEKNLGQMTTARWESLIQELRRLNVIHADLHADAQFTRTP